MQCVRELEKWSATNLGRAQSPALSAYSARGTLEELSYFNNGAQNTGLSPNDMPIKAGPATFRIREQKAGGTRA